MFCTTCGQQLPETAHFCSKCGGAVDTDPNATVLGENPDFDGNLETLAPDIPEAPRPAARTTPRPASWPASTPSRPRSSPPSSPLMTTSDPIGGGRFAPGAIVAGGYRIVGPSGRARMGVGVAGG